MAKLQVRFSTAEIMLILTTMRISSFPSLQQSSLGELTEEESRGALMGSRDSLVARGLARISGKGDLELHPLVLAAVGVAVRPEAGFWLSVVGGDSEPVNIYFNWTRRIIISNWMDREGVFHFEQIKGKNLIAEEVLKHSRVDSTEAKGERKSYVVPASLLKQITDEQKVRETHIVELQKAGVADEDARDFLQAIVHPTQRSILVAVSNMREQPKTDGAVIWIAKEKHRWLITEHNRQSDLATLRLAYGADILKAVSDLVAGVIDSVLEQG